MNLCLSRMFDNSHIVNYLLSQSWRSQMTVFYNLFFAYTTELTHFDSGCMQIHSFSVAYSSKIFLHSDYGLLVQWKLLRFWFGLVMLDFTTILQGYFTGPGTIAPGPVKQPWQVWVN